MSKPIQKSRSIIGMKAVSCLVISSIAASSCSVSQSDTARVKIDQNKGAFKTQTYLEEQLEDLPSIRDPRAQITILNQDNDEPIKVTTSREVPQNIPFTHQNYSFTPTVLQKVVEGQITQETGLTEKERAHQQLQNTFPKLTQKLWEVLIKTQHEIKLKVKAEYDKEISRTNQSSPEYARIQTLYETNSKDLEFNFEQQRKALQQVFKDEGQNLKTKIEERYKDEFHIQDCSWPFGCPLEALITVVEVATLVVTSVVTSIVSPGNRQVALTSVHEAFNGFKDYLAKDHAWLGISSGNTSPTPPPGVIENKATVITANNGTNGVSMAEGEQVVISDPSRLPNLSTDDAIKNTLNFLKKYASLEEQGFTGHFSIPIFVSDILKKAEIEVNFNKYSSQCSALRDQNGGFITDMSQLYEPMGDIYSTKCDIAVGNIFHNLDQRLKDIMGQFDQQYPLLSAAISYDPADLEALTKSPSLANDVGKAASLLEELYIHNNITGISTYALPRGRKLIESDIKNNILALVNFNQNTDKNLADWLVELTRRYYSESLNPATENKIRKWSEGKNLIFRIITPERCAANIVSVEPEGQFGEHGFGSVMLGTTSENIIFDGGYTFELGYYTTTATQREWQQIASASNIPVADLLNLSVDKLRRKGYNPVSLTGGINPLTMTEIEGQDFYNLLNGNLRDIERASLGIQIRNKTANYWDLQVNSVGDPYCPAAFEAKCIPHSETSFHLNHLNYRTGLYQISTRFSMSRAKEDFPFDPKISWEKSGIDSEKRFYGKNEGSSRMSNSSSKGEPFAYQFLATHVDYATFTRVTSKPSSANLTTRFDPNAPSIKINGIEGQAEFFTPTGYSEILPDPSRLPSVTATPSGNRKSVHVIAEAIKNSDLSPLSTSAQNLLVDISSQHTNGTSPGPFDAFNEAQLTSCEKNKFIQVGAVINLTNDNSLNNQALFQKDGKIPMRLVIRKKAIGQDSASGSSNPILWTWGFDAKIGANTIVENYWDGRPIDSLSGFKTSELPDYVTGEYEVSVDVDNGLLNSRRDTLSSKEKFNAQVSPPIILDTSTKATIKVNNNNCNEDCKFLSKIQSEIRIAQEQLASIDWTPEYLAALDSNKPGFSTAQSNIPNLETFLNAEDLIREINIRIAAISSACAVCNPTEVSKNAEEFMQYADDLWQRNLRPAERITLMNAMRVSLVAVLVVTPMLATVGSAQQGLREGRIEYALEAFEKHKKAQLEDRIQSKECLDLTGPLKAGLEALNTNLIDTWKKIKEDRSALITKYGRGSQESEYLKGIDIAEARIIALYYTLYYAVNQAQKDCDPCTQNLSNPSEKEHLCKICGLDELSSKKFKQAAAVRSQISNQLNSGNKHRLKSKTVGFGDLAPNNLEHRKYFIGVSGSDFDRGVAPTNGVYAFSNIYLSIERAFDARIVPPLRSVFGIPMDLPFTPIYLAKEARNLGIEPRFISAKSFTDNVTGEVIPNQDDAEIKILETAHSHVSVNDFRNLSIFTDRQTCPFCKEVFWRLNEQFHDGLQPVNVIFDRFPIVTMIGGPFYPSDKIDVNYVNKALADIASNPKACEQFRRK